MQTPKATGGAHPRLRATALLVGSVGSILGIAPVRTASAQCTVDAPRRLLAPEGWANDRAGAALAASDGWLAVGTPSRDAEGAGVGAVNLLHGADDAWVFAAYLPAPMPEMGGHFGAALAMSGRTLAVGAPGEGGAAGRVHLFERDERGAWSWSATVTAPYGTPGDLFGSAVALAGDRLVVGARGRDLAGLLDVGVAYVFARGADGWTLDATIASPTLHAHDRFGTTVAAAGSRIAIGAPGADGESDESGLVLVLAKRNGAWIAEAELRPTSAGTNDRFGAAVSLREDLLVVGAPGADPGLADAGLVHVHRRWDAGWTTIAIIGAAEPHAGAAFGSSVAIADAGIVVGAVGAPLHGWRGRGFELLVADGAAWRSAGRFGPAVEHHAAGYGAVAAAADGAVLLGVAGDDTLGDEAGAVHAMPLRAPDCDGNGRCDALDIAAGDATDCDEDGLPDACAIARGLVGDVDADGVPDGCADCDADGVPDGRAVAFGAAADCDGNGVPDACDIAALRVRDCDGNGIPDPCEALGPFRAATDELVPLRYQFPQRLRIEEPRPALGPVRIVVRARGDLDAPLEYLRVFVGTTLVGSLFVEAPPCEESEQTLVLPDLLWNTLLREASAIEIVLAPTAGVNGLPCPDNRVWIAVEYDAIRLGDADLDGLPDACARRACPGDLDGDGHVGPPDLVLLMSAWGDGVAIADLDGDGLVGQHDLARLLGAWGRCRTP